MNIDMAWLEEQVFHRNLDESEAQLIEGLIELRDYHQGEIIINEGDQAEGLFILRTGRVSLQHEKHGQPVRLASLDAGAQLGDMALFNSQPASVTVKAVEACSVYYLPAEAVGKLVNKGKDMGRDLMLNTIRNLGDAVRNMNGLNANAQQYIQGKR
ncbi:MAG: cyclic nucleotide-binding domain-containing protein [Mariprofundaceae bacterium]